MLPCLLEGSRDGWGTNAVELTTFELVADVEVCPLESELRLTKRSGVLGGAGAIWLRSICWLFDHGNRNKPGRQKLWWKTCLNLWSRFDGNACLKFSMMKMDIVSRTKTWTRSFQVFWSAFRRSLGRDVRRLRWLFGTAPKRHFVWDFGMISNELARPNSLNGYVVLLSNFDFGL